MYQDIVNRYIQSRNDLRQKERGDDTGEWHPSSLTGCPRLAVYAYSGAKPSDAKDIRSIRIMDRGTEIHTVMQVWTSETIIEAGGTEDDYLPEVKVDFAGIKGSCDALLNLNFGTDVEPLYEVQEYKSISPNGKRYMSGPKPEHVMQARIYRACLNEMGYNVSTIVRIVYVDRDDWSVDEYEADAWLDVEWHEFLGGVADLEDHVQEGTLPPRMPMTQTKAGPKKFWLCNYCDYRTRCWEKDND